MSWGKYTVIVEPSKIYIRKVHALHRNGKGLAPFSTSAHPQGMSTLQRQLAGSLATALPHPSGLSPAAILCVRTLRSPQPLQLSTQATRAPRSWEQAVAVSFQQLIRRAVRPAHGEVPAHAEAVLFADRAEMLACLACDCCKGLVGSRWWWKSLFHEQDPRQAVVSAWLAQPAYIPAALQHLTQMGQVIPFLQSLHSAETQSMVSSIIACFALQELQPLSEAEQASALIEQAYQWRLSYPFRTASWQKWVPESADSRLQLEQQWLLAIGLTLMRAPAAAHSLVFAHAVIHEQSEENEPVANGTTALLMSVQQADKALELAADETPALLADEQRADEILEVEIDTELGGLFYLINLSLFLGLYGDFTTPLQPGIALSIWDFLALLGWELTGKKRQSDPVWRLLARLAGRSIYELPGSDFIAPESWRVPVEWLQPFTETGPWQWAKRNGRLQVWHPAQFLVLDVPLEIADPLTQLATELRAYGPVEVVPGTWPLLQTRRKRSAQALTRWLDWLMPYVRARLRRALGLTQADDLANVLCRHHAHISLTATHLDLVLALNQLPIEVRLSGLDRNPGWVPAAGRYIAFHFE